MNIELWISPFAFVAAGIVLGFLLDRLIVRRFQRIAARTPWEWDDILWTAVAGFPFLWCFLWGLYGAIRMAPIAAEQMRTAEKVLIVLAIISVTIVLARIATGIASAYSRKSGQFPSATILANLTRVFVYVLGLLTIFYSFGINITPALTALGIGGLAVALALQDTLSNFFAGLQIIASRQISTGDFIKLNSGEEGYVADITWRNTTLHTLSNNVVVIPNSKIATDIFTNYHLPQREIVVTFQLGVAYDTDLAHVERVTAEVAAEVMTEVPGGVPEWAPQVRFHAFAESSINLSVIMRGKDYTDQGLIRHEFIKKLQERYKREKIQIPFPVRTVFLEERSPRGKSASS